MIGYNELLTVIQDIVTKQLAGTQFTDVRYGTVLTINPLSISRGNNADPIPAGALLLTHNVVEKKLEILGHSHSLDANLEHTHGVTVTGSATTTIALNDLTPTQPELEHSHDVTVTSTGTTDPALGEVIGTSTERENLVFWVNGKRCRIDGNFAIWQENLAVGDKVILLKASDGQKWIVWDRVVEA